MGIRRADTEIILLGGKRFAVAPIDSGVHVAYVGTSIIQCKRPILAAAAKIATAGLAQRLAVAREIAASLYEAGQVFPVLAAFLTENGAAWSLERAVRNAAFFAQLTTDADRRQLALAVQPVLFTLQRQWYRIAELLDEAQERHVRPDPADSSGRRFIIVE